MGAERVALAVARSAPRVCGLRGFCRARVREGLGFPCLVAVETKTDGFSTINERQDCGTIRRDVAQAQFWRRADLSVDRRSSDWYELCRLCHGASEGSRASLHGEGRTRQEVSRRSNFLERSGGVVVSFFVEREANDMKRILWLSRHDMTRVQKHRLLELLPEEERSSAVVSCRMHVWRTSDDEEADNEKNAEAWREMNAEADVIAGVFPPTALTGLLVARGMAENDGEFASEWFDPMVVTPVSQIDTRAVNGKAQKRFLFLRWQRI